MHPHFKSNFFFSKLVDFAFLVVSSFCDFSFSFSFAIEEEAYCQEFGL